MPLSFWETRRGTQLADTLIRHLPKLTGKVKQEVFTCDKLGPDPAKSVANTIRQLIDDHYTIEQVVPVDNTYVIIARNDRQSP